MSMNRTAMRAASASLAALSLLATAAALASSPQKKATPAPAKKAAPAVQQYECPKCHMRYSAADAKKNHYIDPMDGGKLVPVKAAPATPKKGATAPKPTPKPKP
jgi:hypothetical protein